MEERIPQPHSVIDSFSQSFTRLQLSSPSTRGGSNPLEDDDDDEYIEQPVDATTVMLGSSNNANHNSPSGAYLSGVGDLSCSVTLVDFRRDAFSQMKQQEVLEYVSCDSGKAKQLMAHNNDEDEEGEEDDVEELVLEDEDLVVDEEECDTEVEYYEDSEIEEIELDDDDGYEEIVVLEGGPSSSNLTEPPLKSTVTTRSEDTAPTDDDGEMPVNDDGNDDDDDDEDDINQDPPPSREEVAEAITYMVRQEKVVEYGLMTKQQVDEMNELPLEEMMEIMKHFEICDNNNATIQWDLVLAMINPDYANLDDGDESDGEPEAAPTAAAATTIVDAASSKAAAAGASVCDGPDGCGSNHHDHHAESAIVTDAHLDPHDASSAVDDEGDVFTIQSDMNQFATCHEAASIGSSYSLEVDQSEGGMSNLTYLDAETSDDEIFVLEGGGTGGGGASSGSPVISMDPRIRAMYTKSMVELTKSHSFEE